ncbi:hypothetical protein HPB52_015837 [Rhipicephalus sanguineus]|uniref:CCHC-type domain-containing protein n=1 Tax=Rhipicephalus sanguineus TaxID=34632 RepID=A0A9D4PS00_RHISA|nr:hypothetical protein HPB52_015837 [Rhipicephalus sanguineus]
MQFLQNSTPSTSTFTPYTNWVIQDINKRRNETTEETAPNESSAQDQDWTTVTNRHNKRPTNTNQEETWHPRYAPRLNPDGFIAVIKPKVTCHLAKYKGQCVFAEAIHKALLQATEATDQHIDFTQYGLYPIWDQNIIVINTPCEDLIHRILKITTLVFPDKSVPVHSYLKPTDKMGRGVIRIANHISTDYIVERTVSPANKVIGARRLGTTNVVVLTFEHANIPRNVLIFGENNPVQKYRKTVPTCFRCGTIGHRNDVCPNPSAPPNSCPSCGKGDVNLADHECPSGCLLCNGPHTTGARECPKRFRPASKGPRYDNEGNPSTTPTQENLNQRASRSRSPSRQRGATKNAEHQKSEGQSPGPNPESRPASPAVTTGKHRSRSRSRGPKQASKNPQMLPWFFVGMPVEDDGSCFFVIDAQRFAEMEAWSAHFLDLLLRV